MTLGASGTTYVIPYTGVFYSKGLNGRVILNDKREMTLLINGCQIDVEKGEKIKIIYTQRLENAKILIFAKKDCIYD